MHLLQSHTYTQLPKGACIAGGAEASCEGRWWEVKPRPTRQELRALGPHWAEVLERCFTLDPRARCTATSLLKVLVDLRPSRGVHVCACSYVRP